MQDLKQKNLFSMALAHRYRKGMVVTTDTHTGHIGKAYTIAEGEDFHEYFDNIRKGRSYMVMENPSWKHLTQEITSWIELVFSMEKKIREETGFTTGMGKIDGLVSLLDQYGIGHHPRLNKAIVKSMHLCLDQAYLYFYILFQSSHNCPGLAKWSIFDDLL